MSTLFVVARKGKSLAGACGRIPELDRGFVSRGHEPAAGRYHIVARLAARARRSRGGAGPASRTAEGRRMTTALLLARDCIIYSVNVWVAPVECAFDMIEAELVRRGVDLEAVEQPTTRAV